MGALYTLLPPCKGAREACCFNPSRQTLTCAGAPPVCSLHTLCWVPWEHRTHCCLHAKEAREACCFNPSRQALTCAGAPPVSSLHTLCWVPWEHCTHCCLHARGQERRAALTQADKLLPVQGHRLCAVSTPCAGSLGSTVHTAASMPRRQERRAALC